MEPGVVFTIPVRKDRVEEFEHWVRDVLDQAVAATRMMPPFRLFRTDEVDDDAVVFLVVGEGSEAGAYELQPMFDAAYGEERARAETTTFSTLLAREQVLWVLTPAS